MKIKTYCILAFLTLSTSLMAQVQSNNRLALLDKQMRKFIFTQSSIAQLYVDSVDIEKITEAAIWGMLKELDPHSIYTPAKDVEALNETITGGKSADNLYATDGDDVFQIIEGSAVKGDTVYDAKLGDNIVFGTLDDTGKFISDAGLDKITFSKSGDDLVLTRPVDSKKTDNSGN